MFFCASLWDLKAVDRRRFTQGGKSMHVGLEIGG